jgi:hypothetical protein
MSNNQQESPKFPLPEKRLTLNNLGLAKETVLILKNRVHIKENPSKEDLDKVAEKYSKLLFPTKPVNYAWVLHHCQQDLVNLSYLVTTPEGQPFIEAYQYLHHLTGSMMAQAPKRYGNVFMVFGGKEYLFQFPNEYHRSFIAQLLNTEKDEESWNIPMYGGWLGQEFVTTARDYITELSEVPYALSDVGVAVAVRFSHYGVSSWTGMFLERISPEGIRDKEPDNIAAKVYLNRRKEVRTFLVEAANILNNPGLIIEHIEEYLMREEWYYYQGLRIPEYIYALKNVTGDHFVSYQKLLLEKIASLETDKRKVPEPVKKALEIREF